MKRRARWILVTEGLTRFYVPNISLLEKAPPKSPAFFNPHARLNRDLTVGLCRALARTLPSSPRFADALAGVGARGLRVAVEVPEVAEVYMNDINRNAMRKAKESAAENRVTARCQFSSEESCLFLLRHAVRGKRFEMVDLDPFGSPAPYLDCGVRAVRDSGVLSFTATDTAALCGVYPQVALRKYHGRSLRTDYCHEIGARLLFGALTDCAGRFDLGVEPVFTHSSRHYMRVYARLKAGATAAEEALAQLGFIFHCFRCGRRTTGSELVEGCVGCKNKLRVAGPLWLGPLFDGEILPSLSEVLSSLQMEEAARLVERAFSEKDMPATYYVIDRVADELGVPSPGPEQVVLTLRASGFRASRTSFNPRGVKTDALPQEVNDVVRGLAGLRS